MGYRSQSTKFLTYSNGKDGTGVNIKGSYETYDALIAAHPTGAPGDAYLVQGNLYVWPEDSNNWVNAGNIQGPMGPMGPQGTQGPTGPNGESTYFHVKYAEDENGTNISDNPNTYIGTYVDSIKEDSMDPAKYTWTRIEGIDGKNGINGTNGQNGKTFYLHIAYATSADGSEGFSTTISAGKTYMGQYVDENITDPETPSVYKWSLIKGDKGDKGDKGNKGDTGDKGDKGDAGAPALPANTSENIRVFLRNNSPSIPDKPETGATLTGWVTTELVAEEGAQYVWTCTGNKITTYSWKDETTKTEYKATITHDNWTKPELWGAWGADNIDQKTYATYLKLMNGKTGGLEYDDEGKLYVKAELIQANNILVKDSSNRTILSASGSGTSSVMVQIGGWNIDHNSIYHLVGNTTNGYQIQMSALSGNASVAFGVREYQNKVESWPFFVRNDGYFSATNANITGILKAISGEFNNCTINDTCNITKINAVKGDIGGITISDNSISSSGIFQRGSIISPTSTFKATLNGDYNSSQINTNGDYSVSDYNSSNSEVWTNYCIIIEPQTSVLISTPNEFFITNEIPNSNGSSWNYLVHCSSQIEDYQYTNNTDVIQYCIINVNPWYVITSPNWVYTTSINSFELTSNGTLKCENAVIKGKIEATEGYFASGCKIGHDNGLMQFFSGILNATFEFNEETEDYEVSGSPAAGLQCTNNGGGFYVTEEYAWMLGPATSKTELETTTGLVINKANQLGFRDKSGFIFQVKRDKHTTGETERSYISSSIGINIGNSITDNDLIGTWWGAGDALISGSDYRLKSNFTEFNGQDDIFFDNLKPKSYTLVKGRSGRYHNGFIAQEVIEGLIEANKSVDLTALVCSRDPTNSESYWGLRYEEFIALNTWQIQKLKPRMTAAEEKILQLESEIKSLRAELQNLKNS